MSLQVYHTKFSESWRGFSLDSSGSLDFVCLGGGTSSSFVLDSVFCVCECLFPAEDII